jgi:hypothetical protein
MGIAAHRTARRACPQFARARATSGGDGCEPYVPWSRGFLEFWLSVYRAANSPRAEAAAWDLAEYLRRADKTFEEAAQ